MRKKRGFPDASMKNVEKFQGCRDKIDWKSKEMSTIQILNIFFWKGPDSVKGKFSINAISTTNQKNRKKRTIAKKQTKKKQQYFKTYSGAK